VVGNDIVQEEMIGAFVQALRDIEAEVRTAAATQIPGMRFTCLLSNLQITYPRNIIGFAALVNREVILREILPCVRELVTDGSQHVRAAIASNISGLAPLLGKEV
jgi:serine/threonine-protein phosphatase 2A regulatory subunit A